MVEIEKNGRVPMRTCSVCGFEFFADLKHFDQDKNRSDGLRSECKACRRAKQKAYKAEERRLIREAREARQRGPVGQETIVAHLEGLIKHHATEAAKYRHHMKELDKCGKALAALKGE